MRQSSTFCLSLFQARSGRKSSLLQCLDGLGPLIPLVAKAILASLCKKRQIRIWLSQGRKERDGRAQETPPYVGIMCRDKFK
jgi:hypothetical protein